MPGYGCVHKEDTMKYVLVIALLLSGCATKEKIVPIEQVRTVTTIKTYEDNSEVYNSVETYTRGMKIVTPVKEETTFDGEWLLYGMMLLPLLAL